MRPAIRSIAWYPVALSCLFVVELFVVSGASPFAAARSLLIAFIVGLGLAILGRVLCGTRDIGGLVAMLGVLFLVSLAEPLLSLIIGIAIVGLVVIARLPEGRRPSIRWAMIGTGASRIVIVIALAIGIQAIQLGTPGTIARAWEREGPFRATIARGDAASDAPDVILVLLDGYARADILRDVYGNDDGPFLDALRDRGFDVATASHANYPVTALSLLSLLEMRHVLDIPALEDGQRNGIAQGAILRRALNDAAGLQVLRERGYRIEALGSGFEQVGLREADRFIDTGYLNEFEVQWLILSGLVNAVAPFAPDLIADEWHQRIDSTIDATIDLATAPSDRPRFLLAHIPSPHAPWVHDADGALRPLRDPTNVFQETEEAANIPFDRLVSEFIGQTDYIRGRSLEIVDRIQASATRPTVIAVFSDHGPAAAMARAGYEARLRNLMAVWSTDGRLALDDDATLISLLPTILRDAVGVDVVAAPDTLYQWDTGSDLTALSPIKAGP